MSRGEGLSILRFLLVLGTMAPLFLLTAIKGDPHNVLPPCWLEFICALLIAIPLILVYLRFRAIKKNDDTVRLVVGSSEDRNTYVFTYLFSVLFPFYRGDLESIRDLIAMCVALCLLAFVFWKLNQHYLNILLALFGYRIFTVTSPEDGNSYTGREQLVLITWRKSLQENKEYSVCRITNTVYLEKHEQKFSIKRLLFG